MVYWQPRKLPSPGTDLATVRPDKGLRRGGAT